MYSKIVIDINSLENYREFVNTKAGQNHRLYRQHETVCVALHHTRSLYQWYRAYRNVYQLPTKNDLPLDIVVAHNSGWHRSGLIEIIHRNVLGYVSSLVRANNVSTFNDVYDDYVNTVLTSYVANKEVLPTLQHFIGAGDDSLWSFMQKKLSDPDRVYSANDYYNDCVTAGCVYFAYLWNYIKEINETNGFRMLLTYNGSTYETTMYETIPSIVASARNRR